MHTPVSSAEKITVDDQSDIITYDTYNLITDNILLFTDEAMTCSDEKYMNSRSPRQYLTFTLPCNFISGVLSTHSTHHNVQRIV